MPAVAAAFIVGGTIVKAYGEYKAGKAAEELGQKQQDLYNQQADNTLAASRDAGNRFREQGRQFVGTQKSVIGASGLAMAGSAQDVVQRTEQQIGVDYNRILEKGRQDAAVLRESGKIAEQAGDQALYNSYWQSASTILTGFGSAASLYI